MTGLTLGLLLSLVGRSELQTGGTALGDESTRIQLSIAHLEKEQESLRTELEVLRQELAGRQQTAAADTDRLRALTAELNRQQLLVGLEPVRGPGVLVTLDDSAIEIPPGADANAFVIHEYELRDIVNLLWMAGSEAIAINDERLVNQSSIYCVGSTVMVNNTRLSPPYQIRALGNPRVQQDYLRNPSYLRDLKEKQQRYGLVFSVQSMATMEVPAYRGGFLMQHARPGE
ncbi:MAG: DUF881 domain-containing protein [Anaerolineae bacterium]